MRDIREIVQEALDSCFGGAPIVIPEEMSTGNIPDEYITYNIVSGVYTAYANGRPIQRRDNIDVNWYGNDISLKMPRMVEIESAMTAAGFMAVSLPSDIDRSNNADYYGATMEFALYRAVPSETPEEVPNEA